MMNLCFKLFLEKTVSNKCHFDFDYTFICDIYSIDLRCCVLWSFRLPTAKQFLFAYKYIYLVLGFTQTIGIIFVVFYAFQRVILYFILGMYS